MNKEFKFPRAAPPIAEEALAEAAEDPKPPSDIEHEAEEANDNPDKPFVVTPPEVFTPPVVQKDETPGPEPDYGDDDVGPTVEVDLN